MEPLSSLDTLSFCFDFRVARSEGEGIITLLGLCRQWKWKLKYYLHCIRAPPSRKLYKLQAATETREHAVVDTGLLRTLQFVEGRRELRQPPTRVLGPLFHPVVFTLDLAHGWRAGPLALVGVGAVCHCGMVPRVLAFAGGGGWWRLGLGAGGVPQVGGEVGL